MNFELNGESVSSEAPLTIQALLDRFDLAGRKVAVAVNQEIVPRARYAEARVREGDRVEVIQAVGGG